MTGAGGWTCLRGGQIYYMSGSFRLNHMFACFTHYQYNDQSLHKIGNQAAYQPLLQEQQVRADLLSAAEAAAAWEPANEQSSELVELVEEQGGRA